MTFSSPRAASRMLGFALTACIACLALVPLSGCSSTIWRGGQTTVRIESPMANTQLSPRYAASVYAFRDRNTADVILSTWDEQELRDFGEGRSRLRPGSMTHLHFFLVPQAGRTPIAFTANNVTLSHLIVTGNNAQEAGYYGGGGFLLPDSRPGDKLFGGVIREGTLRAIDTSAGFNDLLVGATFSGTIRAERDDQTAEQMLAWMREMASTRAVEANRPADKSGR